MIMRLNLIMTNELEILRLHIRRRGLRDTAQREEVLRLLLASREHRSTEDIYQNLRSRGAAVGRATVFRTLKLLEECGLASKVTFADGTHKFERAHGRPHHDHMICMYCGSALEFTNPVIERLQVEVARKRGFHVVWHRHEMFGHCARCRVRNGKTASRSSVPRSKKPR